MCVFWVFVCVRVWVCLCSRVLHTQTHTHTHILTYTCVYICTCSIRNADDAMFMVDVVVVCYGVSRDPHRARLFHALVTRGNGWPYSPLLRIVLWSETEADDVSQSVSLSLSLSLCL